MTRLWDNFRRGMAIARIPLVWFQTVTAWLNGMAIVNGRVERTPNGIIIYPNTDGGGLNQPWASAKVSDNTVRVVQGRWLHNLDNGNGILTLNCGANDYLDVAVGNDQYVCAVLSRSSLVDYDDRLKPETASVVAVNSVNTVMYANYGGVVVLGKMTGGEYQQYWYGGDITSDEQVGDEDTRRTSYPDAHSIEKNEYHEYQLSDFIDGTASGDLTSQDRVVIRFAENTLLRVKYATPKNITDASGAAGGTMPPSAHTHDADDLTIAHSNLTDVVSQTVGDDHRGGRTAATAISSGHPYIHANGDSTRNAMPGVIGDSSGGESIEPSGKVLHAGPGGTNKAIDWGSRKLIGIAPAPTWECSYANFHVSDGTKSFKHGSDTGFTDSRTFTQVFDDGTSVKLRYAGGLVVPA